MTYTGFRSQLQQGSRSSSSACGSADVLEALGVIMDLGPQVGFDSLFFARIDYQDRAKRKDEKSLEVVWQGSKSLGSSAQIFSGAFPENYELLSNFYYEVNDDSPIVQIRIRISTKRDAYLD